MSLTATAGFAYGNARVRARKSRLVPAPVLRSLVTADQPALTVEGWRDLASAADAPALLALVYGRLIGDYVMAIRAFPAARAVLQALARLHELENLKLAWRAVLRRAPPAAWRDAWRPMGALETVRRQECDAVATVRQLAAVLGATPYAAIAHRVAAAHADDLAAAELTLDRWGSGALAAAALALPPRERRARDLACLVVRERDAAMMVRAIRVLGVDPLLAPRMCALPVREPRGERRIRAARRLACRRAFFGDPFTLAPPLALVLAREDEARTLLSVAELRARRATPAMAARVLDFDG
ncbi:MAG: V-type ATPase subunit [Acidobacteria bacterium]|nr:V-type ATPase subunit [Acidobacteriota bacterium]